LPSQIVSIDHHTDGDVMVLKFGVTRSYPYTMAGAICFVAQENDKCSSREDIPWVLEEARKCPPCFFN
jgi:hypothetical protein